MIVELCVDTKELSAIETFLMDEERKSLAGVVDIIHTNSIHTDDISDSLKLDSRGIVQLKIKILFTEKAPLELITRVLKITKRYKK